MTFQFVVWFFFALLGTVLCLLSLHLGAGVVVAFLVGILAAHTDYSIVLLMISVCLLRRGQDEGGRRASDAEIEQVVTWRWTLILVLSAVIKSRSQRHARDVHTEQYLGADRWVPRPGTVELPPPGLRVWRKRWMWRDGLETRMSLMTSLSLREFEHAQTTPQSSPSPWPAVASRIVVESWWGRSLRPSEEVNQFQRSSGMPGLNPGTADAAEWGLPDRTKGLSQSPSDILSLNI